MGRDTEWVALGQCDVGCDGRCLVGELQLIDYEYCEIGFPLFFARHVFPCVRAIRGGNSVVVDSGMKVVCRCCSVTRPCLVCRRCCIVLRLSVIFAVRACLLWSSLMLSSFTLVGHGLFGGAVVVVADRQFFLSSLQHND